MCVLDGLNYQHRNLIQIMHVGLTFRSLSLGSIIIMVYFYFFFFDTLYVNARCMSKDFSTKK